MSANRLTERSATSATPHISVRSSENLYSQIYNMENIIASPCASRRKDIGVHIRRIVIVGYSSELRLEKSRRKVSDGDISIRPRETRPWVTGYVVRGSAASTCELDSSIKVAPYIAVSRLVAPFTILKGSENLPVGLRHERARSGLRGGLRPGGHE